MWRKSDEKPSSGTSNVPGSVPPKTWQQTPTQTEAQPKQAKVERSATPPAPQPVAHTVSAPASQIGPGLIIRGEISGNSDLYLDGQATGKIHVNGARVTVGPQGKVQADIEAREIVVNGHVQGNLKADARVRLGASSQVEGALAAPSIGIDDGARFRGKVEVTRTKSAPKASEPESASDSELRPVGASAESE
ncbi:MAG: polymer-forming cytoskeletal protein [Candidatus Acidiferrales bacterium]